jgi:branched-chain amino acid transport system substrate-binding protein
MPRKAKALRGFFLVGPRSSRSACLSRLPELGNRGINIIVSPLLSRGILLKRGISLRLSAARFTRQDSHMNIKLNHSIAALVKAILIALVGTLPAAAQSPVARPFRIGAVLPLHGPLADYGAALRNGIELAQRDYPSKFQTVEVVYQDSSYDGKTSLSAFNALRARGDIDLYYVWGVTPNETLLPVLAARNLPVISETTLKRSLVNRPFAIRAAPTGDMTARVLSDELVRQGARSFGVLLVDIPYYRDIVEAMKVYLAQAGAQLEIVDTYTADTNDFKSVVTKLKSRRYDSLGVFLLPDQIPTYYRQAFALGYTTRTFGAAIHDSQDLITRSGPGAEGAMIVVHDVTDEFRRSWLSAFGNDSRIGNGATAYDTLLLIADLFGDGLSHGLSPREIVTRFASATGRNGASGHFVYAETPDAGKHFDFPLSLRTIKAGALVPVR